MVCLIPREIFLFHFPQHTYFQIKPYQKHENTDSPFDSGKTLIAVFLVRCCATDLLGLRFRVQHIGQEVFMA